MRQAKKHKRTFYPAWDALKKQYEYPKTRRLSAGWTIEMTSDLRTMYGRDANEELAAIFSAQSMAIEIDEELLKDILNGATTRT